MKKPNVVVAIVLGLIAPGAGLLYAGWAKTALVVIVLFVASAVGLPYLATAGTIDPARLPSLWAIDALLLIGPAAGAGAVAAVRAQPSKRPPWTHPWWVLGVVILTWFSTSQLRARVVVPHLVSFTYADARYEPDIKEGALVVVKRRYAPDEVRPDALVLVSSPKGDHLRRVRSTDSGIVLDDDTRVSPADVLGVAVPAR